MPSTATITSYYSFTANTKARANQVNNNFDVWRGHHIPIDPNTQTAINNTYDLGSSEYYWKTGYIKTIYQAPTDATTSAGINGFAASAQVNQGFISGSAGAYNIPNSTCTIQSFGRPVMVKFFSNTTTGCYISGAKGSAVVGLMRDSTTITVSSVYLADTNLSFPLDGIGTFDFVAAGTRNYSAYFRTIIWTTTAQYSLAFRVGAVEL